LQLDQGGGLDAVNAQLKRVRPDAQAVESLGGDGKVLVETPRGAKNSAIVSAVGKLKGVKFFEPNFAVYATATNNDPLFSPYMWHLNNTGQSGGTADADIDAPEAWDVSTGSSGVVVGVIDSGIDYTHPDLAANMWKNPGEIAGDGKDNDHNGYIDDVYGWDFYNNDANPMDDNGHGTHVAGTIAAVGNNAVGVTGVSWNSKVMALKFLGADGSGGTAGAIKALDYARMMKTTYGVNVRITNNSWAGGGYSQALQDAIARTQSADMLFIAAAGNGDAYGNGLNNDVYASYPSNSPSANVIAVAATDRNDRLASFSNYGATQVDLAAPGVDIASTYPGNRYVYMSGTSMATPVVSGVAALAWSVAPTATYQQIKNAILGGVDKIAGLSGKVLTGGRVNARKTLELLAFPTKAAAGGPYALNEGQGVTLTRTNSTDPNGDVVRYSWDVNGDGTFGDETKGTPDASGQSLSFTWAQLGTLGINDGPASYAVRVRSDDGKGHLTVSDASTLTVSDVAPALAVSGPDSVAQGSAYALTLGPVSDSGNDLVSQYVINWGDGSSGTYAPAEVEAAGRTLSHTYGATSGAGARTIIVDLRDEDGTHAAVASKLVNVTGISGRNLALNKPATQSSTGYGGEASRAVDGNTDGNFNDASVTHTNDDAQAWWQVDLGEVESIGSVQVFNRTDAAPERLSDFYVLVSDTPFASTDLAVTLAQSGVSAYRVSGQAGTPTEVPVGRSGRYVRVQLAGSNYLSLAEVRVFGPDGGAAMASAASATSTGVFATRPIAKVAKRPSGGDGAVWA
jgi:subtilisin family serine protease